MKNKIEDTRTPMQIFIDWFQYEQEHYGTPTPENIIKQANNLNSKNMNTEVKGIRATVEINVKYGDFSINISNTHDRKIYYKVSENSTNKGWERVSHLASDYIVNDFKKTAEHQKIINVIREATKDYGY